jgi:predicted nucleotidyltransferase
MADDIATTLGLTPRHYKIVTDLLAKHVAGRPVWAFGSRTFGQARRYSDLDLAIGGSAPLPAATEYELIDAFDDSMLPIEVDVIDLNDVDAEFRRRIEPDFLLLQAGQGEVRLDAA